MVGSHYNHSVWFNCSVLSLSFTSSYVYGHECFSILQVKISVVTLWLSSSLSVSIYKVKICFSGLVLVPDTLPTTKVAAQKLWNFQNINILLIPVSVRYFTYTCVMFMHVKFLLHHHDNWHFFTSLFYGTKYV